MSVHYYSGLLSYEHRIDAFKRAIEACVRPGDRVLDVGTGLGTFAFFAVRAGAGSVVAVDEGAVIHLAETLAAANGVSDRIRFVRGSLPDVSLEGHFDVIVFEDFPTSLLDASTFRLPRSLQTEYLAPGGRMLPRSARLNLAPVQSKAVHAETFPLDEEGSRFDLDWSGVRPFLANTPRQVGLALADLRGEVVEGPSIPLMPAPTLDSVRIEGRWEAGDSGPVHGLALWFDLEVGEGDWISNAPGPRSEPWGQWFLPVDPPLEVEQGATVEASFWRESGDEGVPGWAAWECRTGDVVRRGHEFAGVVAGPEDLIGVD